jgi:hypothetical protein
MWCSMNSPNKLRNSDLAADSRVHDHLRGLRDLSRAVAGLPPPVLTKSGPLGDDFSDHSFSDPSYGKHAT